MTEPVKYQTDREILAGLAYYIRVQPNMKDENGDPLTLPLLRAYNRLQFYVEQNEVSQK